jgi:hypothetical protein
MRRSKTLTDQARTLFESEIIMHGWIPAGTVPRVAKATGLTEQQVRDSVFSEPADEWRRALTVRLMEEANAV